MMQPQPGVIPPPMQIDQQPPQQQPPMPPQQFGQPPPAPGAAAQQPWLMPPNPQPAAAAAAPAPAHQQMWPQQQPPPIPVPVPGAVGALQPTQALSQQFPTAAPASNPDEVRSLWIGDLQYWMDENYLWTCFGATHEVLSVKVIRNKQTLQSEGYGFIEFVSRAAAERALATYSGALMPSTEQTYRLNWATLGAGQKRQDDSPDYTVFVGDLAAEVTDYMLQETFRARYPSVKGAKVITDHTTGRSKGYGFVKFGEESEHLRAMHEMNGMMCASRPMRIGPAANKKAGGVQQKASYTNSGVNPGENDPSNTTVFVGGLDPNVSDDQLRQVFSQFGELVHVKIPIGKRCGFVQFANRANAEQAISILNGAVIGGQNVRLSWGRSPSNKQVQADPNQWSGAYYGYGQGYDAYSYAAAPQDPNMYYGGYPGYGNYQQPQQ